MNIGGSRRWMMKGSRNRGRERERVMRRVTERKQKEKKRTGEQRRLVNM